MFFYYSLNSLSNLRVLNFKYENNIFKFQSKKTPNKAILVPNLIFFLEDESLHFGKLEDADFKYGNSLFNGFDVFQLSKIRHFLLQTQSVFFLYESSRLINFLKLPFNILF